MTRRIPPGDLPRTWREKESGCDKARAALIEHYGGIVLLTRERAVPHVPFAIDVQDLHSVGFLALIRAVDRFDPGRAVRFESFAISLVRGAMLEHLRHEDFAPRSVRQKEKRLRTAVDTLLLQGEAPTPSALAELLSMDLEAFHRFRLEAEVRLPISWDDVISADEWEDPGPLYQREQFADPAPGPEAVALGRLEAEQQQEAIALLPAPVRHVARRYLYDDLRLKQIAAEIGRSESRVHQRWVLAKAALRAELAR